MSNKFLKGVELNEGADWGYFIPNLTGAEGPTVTTEGAVGSQYMDTTTGKIYKCTAVSDGGYTWKLLEGEGGSTENAVLYIKQNLSKEEKDQARANIGAASADQIGDISSALDELHTYAQWLIDGGAAK